MGDTVGTRRGIGHPLALNSFGHWLRLIRWGGGVQPKYYGRALLVTCFSPLSGIARLHERLSYGRAIAAVEIKQDPIFIVGHWRSGTTYLHNLMCHDPQFGFVTTFQTLAPKSFLAGRRILQPIVEALMPHTRPMDNVALGTELPQEEEFCLANSTRHSVYLYNFFPNTQDMTLFRKYILFDGLDESEFEDWKREYIEIVKKATLHAEGRQLVLKNPCNTARMDAILRVFPKAKFIHIYRDPYVVYKSSIHLRERCLAIMEFQEMDPAVRQEGVIKQYRAMMKRFFLVKEQIPKSQFAEIRYEDLEEHPLHELERVYAELGIEGWETAREPIDRYLETQQGYRKNRFTLTDADRAIVKEQWGFALRQFGYEQPVPMESRKAHEHRQLV